MIESLRPPLGFQLDTAIGTTFTLDLISLLIAPVGFTFFDVDPNDPEFLQQDPLEILEAIRRHAAQIVLFCQAGRISVPNRHRPLLTYLEDRIVEVKTPAAGFSFHPKVWFIRYVNEEDEVAYRLLCSSRNLTFDRCWDTLLTLDGPLKADRVNDIGENAGLRDFIAALPQMAVDRTKLTAGVRKQLRTIQSEIGRVDWNLEGTPFESLKFWPLGHDERRPWPFKGRLQRTAIVSPFLVEGALERIAKCSEGVSAVVSRSESLDTIAGATLRRLGKKYQMATQAAILEPDGAEPATVEPESAQPVPEQPIELQGLHAKLYVADDGHKARIWIGSANATTAAFGGNVEFMVELGGKRKDIGVDAFLEKVKGTASFSDLLLPYSSPEVIEINEEFENLKRQLDDLRLPIASAEWTVAVTQNETGDEYVPTVISRKKLPTWPDHVAIRCRPLSTGESLAVPLHSGQLVEASFKAVALETLTSFLVIQVRGESAFGKCEFQFVVNATLVGAPSNRRERILAHMLKDQRALMRFLFLLLSDAGDDAFATSGKSKSWKRGQSAAAQDDAVLEPLLRTLSRNPSRLKSVRSLLTELSASEESSHLMPAGLKELFDAVWTASGLGVQ